MELMKKFRIESGLQNFYISTTEMSTDQDWSQLWADQDWIGLQFFWKLADQDWTGLRKFVVLMWLV